MGWGHSFGYPWMDEELTPQGSPEDLEDEARLRARAMEMEEPVPEVEDYFPEEYPAGEYPTIMAPQIMGTESPETADVLQQYKDWLSRRPTREQYEPSTGRSIAAVLGGWAAGMGGDPALAGRLTGSILEGPRMAAMRDWEAEGKGLGEVGKFAQDISATRQRREANVLSYEGVQSRVEAQRSAIEQRMEAENLRHQDRMANITEDSAKRMEVARHNKTLEGLAGELNGIRRMEAEARTTSANAYASRVGALNAAEKETRPYPAHYGEAIFDTLGEMLAEYPQFEEYFKRDSGTRKVTGVQKNLELSPVDAFRFRRFLEDARKRARRRIGIPEPAAPDAEKEMVDPYLRLEIP